MDPSQAIPKRWWWTKRLGAAFVVFLAVSGGARWWWASYAQAQLDAEVQAIRDRGEPILPDDFRQEHVPDEQNAALLYIEAASSPLLSDPGTVNPDDPAASRLPSMLEPMLHPPFRRQHPENLEQILVQAAEPIRLIRAGNERDGFAWPSSQWSSGLPGSRYEAVAALRAVPLLLLSAELAAEGGDDAAALALVRDALVLSDRLETTPYWMMHRHTLPAGILVGESLEAIAADLGIGPAPGEASERQVRELIAHLLDDAATRESFVRMATGWRGWMLLVMDGELHRGSTVAKVAALDHRIVKRYVSAPWMILDGARVLRRSGQEVAAARQPTFGGFMLAMPGSLAPPPPVGLTSYRRPVSWRPIYTVPQYAGQHYTMLARRRLAATALAIRLYEVDHGARPATLAALVPEYLPAVPEDPFGTAGETILASFAASPAVLYARGVNGLDDGGAWRVAPDGQIHSADELLFLDRAPSEWMPDWQDPADPDPYGDGWSDFIPYVPADGAAPDGLDAEPATSGSAPAAATSPGAISPPGEPVQ